MLGIVIIFLILFYVFELINICKCDCLHFLCFGVRFRNRLSVITSPQGFVMENPIFTNTHKLGNQHFCRALVWCEHFYQMT